MWGVECCSSVLLLILNSNSNVMLKNGFSVVPSCPSWVFFPLCLMKWNLLYALVLWIKSWTFCGETRINKYLGWQAPNSWKYLLWNIMFLPCVCGFSVLFAVAAGVPRWHFCLWVLPLRSKYYRWRLHKWPGADFDSDSTSLLCCICCLFCLIVVFVLYHFQNKGKWLEINMIYQIDLQSCQSYPVQFPCIVSVPILFSVNIWSYLFECILHPAQMLISSNWFCVAVVSGCVVGHFCSRHVLTGNTA